MERQIQEVLQIAKRAIAFPIGEAGQSLIDSWPAREQTIHWGSMPPAT